MNLNSRFSFLIILILISACSTMSTVTITKTESWKDPAYQGHINKVYVVGVTDVNISRYNFERLLCDELQTRGAIAISSIKKGEYPEEVDDQTIRERALANSADSILSAKINSKFSEQDVYDNVIVEAVIYKAQSGKAIWSGRYRVRFQIRSETVIIDLTKAIVTDLQKDCLL